jgi:hypothetical protein
MTMYRTMQGREFNMDEFRQKNETAVAVSNYGVVNARGDLLGKDGKIIKKRDEIVQEWYNNNQSPVIDEPTTRKERITSDEQTFNEVRNDAIEILDAYKGSKKTKTKEDDTE